MEQNYELYHHGVKGQRWGVRRYQNKDGSLTKLGKKRRGTDDKDEKKLTPEEERAARKAATLNSRDAAFIYKNRELLDLAETRQMREILDENNKIKNMISDKTENRLTKLGIYTKKISEIMDPASKIVKSGKEIYDALKGKETDETITNAKKALENIDNLSDTQLSKLKTRLETTKNIEEIAKNLRKLRDGDDGDYGPYKTYEEALANVDSLDHDTAMKVLNRAKTKAEADKKTNTNSSSDKTGMKWHVAKKRTESNENSTKTSDRVTAAEVERLRKAALGKGTDSPEMKEYSAAVQKFLYQ